MGWNRTKDLAILSLFELLFCLARREPSCGLGGTMQVSRNRSQGAAELGKAGIPRQASFFLCVWGGRLFGKSLVVVERLFWV
jgi:hypothetical protein